MFEELGLEIGKLVKEKDESYGQSFSQAHKILSVLYPNGIRVDQYTDVLATIRIIDKLFRIANNKEAFNEEPFKDISGYGMLGVANERSNQKIHERNA